MKEIQIHLDTDSEGRAVMRVNKYDFKLIIDAVRTIHVLENDMVIRYDVSSESARKLLADL